MAHFNILSTVLILIVGVWAIVEFRQGSRRFPGAGLDDIMYFQIFYCALALAFFFSVYGQNNLTSAQLSVLSFWYKIVEWPALTVLTLGVHLSLYRAIFRRREKDLPGWVVPAAGAFGVVVVAWYFLAQKIPALAPPRPDNSFWLALVWPPGLLDIFWFVRLGMESRKRSDRGRGKVDAALALLFLARYPLHLALSVWNPTGVIYYVGLGLSKLLGFYTVRNLQEGVNVCQDILYFGGLGHSASIASEDPAAIRTFSETLNAGRIIVNSPSAQGGIGDIYTRIRPSLPTRTSTRPASSSTAMMRRPSSSKVSYA